MKDSTLAYHWGASLHRISRVADLSSGDPLLGKNPKVIENLEFVGYGLLSGIEKFERRVDVDIELGDQILYTNVEFELDDEIKIDTEPDLRWEVKSKRVIDVATGRNFRYLVRKVHG